MPAGFWTRFAAQLIDAILITVVSIGIGRAVGSWPAIAIELVLVGAYYSFCEGLTGQTSASCC